jgi:ectoine hydroxylase-related dioxygenase (phytanoyl-CoA dioxygenase family)
MQTPKGAPPSQENSRKYFERLERTMPSHSVAVDDFNDVQADIKRLGLERHVLEIETQGYTVVPPEKVAPPEFVARLREAVLDVAEERNGTRPNVGRGATHANPEVPFGQILFYMLFERPIFQQALLNPTLLSLASYMIGRKCIVSNCVAILKGPGQEDLALHSDNLMIPDPFPPYAHLCNTNWVLTDYSRDNGSICFVPGSHRFCRHPLPGEALDDRVPVDAKAGSIVVWHGHTWHGAFARRSSGLRMSLNTPMMRSYLQPQEAYRDDVTPEMLGSHPPRFATLLGKDINIPWRKSGARYDTVYPGRSLWD